MHSNVGVVYRSRKKIKLSLVSVGINATLECHGHIIYYMNGIKHRPSYTHTHVITWISEITFADQFHGILQVIFNLF